MMKTNQGRVMVTLCHLLVAKGVYTHRLSASVDHALSGRTNALGKGKVCRIALRKDKENDPLRQGSEHNLDPQKDTSPGRERAKIVNAKGGDNRRDLVLFVYL